MIYTSFNVQEVCRQIKYTKQVYIHGGKIRIYTPDKLFDKLTSLSGRLPDDATTWSIHLFLDFLSDLTK